MFEYMVLSGKKNKSIFNPLIFQWARALSGMTINDIAEKMGRKPEQIIEWEEAKAIPTVKQARDLAKCYDRPFIEFFLDEPPVLKEWDTIPDYRTYKDKSNSNDRELKKIQIWASVQRENAIGLLDELNDAPPQIPPKLFADKTESAEQAAMRARTVVGFTSDFQLSIKSKDEYKLPEILRKKLEQIGIMVLKNNNLGKYGARGMCIADFPLPVIVFTKESSTAQSFTISHELGHIVRKNSGIIAPLTYQQSDNHTIETWCDRFAAAFLMPKDMIEKIAGKKPARALHEIADEYLEKFAKDLKVSRHAMLVRLIQLGYVEPNYYWDNKKKKFEEEEKEYKLFGGRSDYYGTRYKNSLGGLYTSLVMEAWSIGRITNDNAARYMGIKNLKHLYDIRDHMGIM